MSLICPRCAAPLSGARHATGIAWRCSGCGGQSLNFSQFRRMIPDRNASEIWMTAMENPSAPRTRTRCPECRSDMAAVIIPFENRDLELTVCRNCQRLWMDSQEHTARQLRSSDGEPAPTPPAIRMTGSAMERLLSEKLRRVRRISSMPEPSTIVLLLVIMGYILIRYLTRR